MPGVLEPPQPIPARLSLVNAAPTPDEIDSSRWEMGFEFAPEACADAAVADPCDVGSRPISARPANIAIEPFIVWAGDTCSTFGFEAEDYVGRAERLLARCESKQIASELWTGTLATAAGWTNNQWLADESSDTVTSGPAAVVDALACLEQALAESGCGERGMIHATRQVVTHWAALGNSVLRREGGQLLTIHDTIVVSDAGYDGSGPDGTPAGASVWAYATGMVTVRRGPVKVYPTRMEDAVDISVGDVEFWAERPVAVSWDGCSHFAAEIDLATCAIGGAS